MEEPHPQVLFQLRECLTGAWSVMLCASAALRKLPSSAVFAKTVTESAIG